MQLFVRDRDFYRRVVRIAVPIAAQSLIMIGVNMTDTLMVGALGETQLSAASLANQFVNIFHIMCMGMGMGAAVLTSQFWGAKNIPDFKKAVAIMLRICVVIASGFMLATLLLPRQIMGIYTTEAPIIESGLAYFRYIRWTYLLQGLALTVTIMLRTSRQVRIPLISSIAAFLANILFNYMFIFGKLGAPEMGIAGAALATLIARVLEFAVICGYFFFFEKRVGFRLPDLFLKCSGLFRDYIQYSMPVFVSDLLLALGNNMVAMVMGRMGSSFVSANAITAVAMQLSTVFIQGISNASAIMIGNTIGEGDSEKVYQHGMTFYWLSAATGLIAGVFILVTSPILIGFYNLTDETRALTRQLMFALAVVVMFQANSSVMTKGVLRGGGDTKFLMVADILFLWVASVPLGYLAGLVFHLPAFWVYFFLKIDNIVKSFWSLRRLVSRAWIREVRSAAGNGTAEAVS